MAHLLLIATYICAVPYILQSGLNLTWNPPNIKRAKQTLVTPFAEKETKAQKNSLVPDQTAKKCPGWVAQLVGVLSRTPKAVGSIPS